LVSQPKERGTECLRTGCLREYLDIRERSNRNSLTGKSEGKRLLGRPTCRWKVKQIGLDKPQCESVDWIHQVEQMIKWQVIINMIMILWVPKQVGNFLTK
jgi:hypothetical protein